MIVGERRRAGTKTVAGKPFVGPRRSACWTGCLAAIDMGRDVPMSKDAPIYITNVLPWRPPQATATPSAEEIAMMRAVSCCGISQLAKHRECTGGLVGNTCLSWLLLNKRKGITRYARSIGIEAAGLPADPDVPSRISA